MILYNEMEQHHVTTAALLSSVSGREMHWTDTRLDTCGFKRVREIQWETFLSQLVSRKGEILCPK